MSKLRYGIREYFKPTPDKVKRLQVAWKGIIASGGIVAITQEHWIGAVGIGIVGFIINELFLFFGDHPEFLAVEQAERALKDKVEEVANEIKAQENE